MRTNIKIIGFAALLIFGVWVAFFGGFDRLVGLGRWTRNKIGPPRPPAATALGPASLKATPATINAGETVRLDWTFPAEDETAFGALDLVTNESSAWLAEPQGVSQEIAQFHQDFQPKHTTKYTLQAWKPGYETTEINLETIVTVKESDH